MNTKDTMVSTIDHQLNRIGISKWTFYSRLRAGWSREDALTKPNLQNVRERNKVLEQQNTLMRNTLCHIHSLSRLNEGEVWKRIETTIDNIVKDL